MSDRHKFRVWILKDYDMGFEDSLTPGWLKDQCEWYQLSPNGQEIQWGWDNPEEPLVIGKDCLVEFCTGLKDKNGQLIYEADILKMNPDDDDWYDKVLFHKGRFELFRFTVYPDPVTMVDLIEAISENNPSVIAGNIHEHPELLGGQDE